MRKPTKIKNTHIQPKVKEMSDLKSSEAQVKLADTPLETEQHPKLQTRRISFVVRLTLDEQGQLGRTEIEDVASGRKQNFLDLDGDRLVSFMKACVNPENTPEDSVSSNPC